MERTHNEILMDFDKIKFGQKTLFMRDLIGTIIMDKIVGLIS